MSQLLKFSETERKTLRRNMLLRESPEPALQALMASALRRRYARGDLVFREGQPCIGLLIILTGAVKVYKLDNRGRELTLGLEGPGASVAELPLFDGGNYPAAAEAAEEGTEIFVVPREHFLEVLRAYPEMAEHALRMMAVRMRRMLSMLEAQSLHTVRARMAAYLLEAAQGRTRFRLEETNEAIAGQVGTVREVVSRTLRSFREGGVIATRNRWIEIRDPTALARIATSEG